MTGFVANGTPATETDIKNHAFFPDINPDDCRQVMRIDANITAERLRHSLINAISDVNTELKAWADTQKAAGHATLNDVPSDRIDDISEKIQQYTRAVFNFAKAEVTERYRDIDTTGIGGQRAEDVEDTTGHYRREGILAIRTILNKPRTSVELI